MHKDNEGICCFKIEDVEFMWLCVYFFIFTSLLRAMAVVLSGFRKAHIVSPEYYCKLTYENAFQFLFVMRYLQRVWLSQPLIFLELRCCDDALFHTELNYYRMLGDLK